ncbi:hypothetical protein [Pseudomonas fluorescens]|uniref:Uncharacterized protein n=1 Tax=Pseudomonas fluorescens TaxID=294 RepID=A0A5E7ECH4_PSEFL|nr:hypothetical protein [Pseudomonas fluorescens]VVO24485.1 hypothetical protein PS710_04512 [Pseudomonas fluorescens]
MSSLVEQPLEHARQRFAGQPQKRTTATSAKISITVPAPTVYSLGVVVDGPTNHFMFLEGRALAIDMVKSLHACPASVVIDRLTGAAAGRPGSYASGISSVIKALKETENAQ